jgi:hypothetical protein
MFYNKKGLLAEIQKTEKKISEKIIVLEDLLDSAKAKSLVFNKSDLSGATKSPDPSSELNPVTTTKLKTDIAVLKKIENESTPTENQMYKPSASTSNTLLRVLSLDDAENLDFYDSSSVGLQSPESLDDTDSESTELDAISSDGHYSNHDDDSDENTTQQEDSLGVTQMILEARENLKKIEVSDNIKLKSFKDVVLMSKKIEFEKRKS